MANKIVASVEANNPPWRTLHKRGFPTNAKTGKKYYGINPLILDVVADERKYRSNLWATYKQWQSLGQKVAKNPGITDWGSPIIIWSPRLKTTINENVITWDKFHLLEQHIVFNAEQTYGTDAAKYILTESAFAPNYAKAEEAIKATGAEVVHKKSVKTPIYERLPKDRILMPLREYFVNDAQYYAALFHELVHYSEWRLGWQGSMGQGELIAEIATGYIESELNLPHDTDFTNHDKWKNEWLNEISKNPSYLLVAATQASRAANFILYCQESEETLQETTNVVKFAGNK